MHRVIKLIPRFVRTLLFGLIEDQFAQVTADDVEHLKTVLLSRVAGILEL